MPPIQNSAAEAAAAARRRAIEAANRRAAAAAEQRKAAAQQKPAENPKKAAAETKKNEALTQRDKAQKAQQTARGDIKQAREARQKLGDAEDKQQLAEQRLNNARTALAARQRVAETKGPKMSDQDRTALREATTRFTRLDKAHGEATQEVRQARTEFDSARTKADASRRTAVQEANKALEAQKTANVAAREAGEPEPFKAANTVRDAYDAGSLDAKAQEKLFGTKSVVSAQEAGRADAKAVAEATQRDPAEGARLLRHQLEGNNDLAYRDTLMKESRGSIDQMTAGLGRPEVTQEQANQLVSDLGHAADLTSPQASRDVADSFRRAEAAPETGEATRGKLDAALKAGAREPAVGRIATGMTDGLRAEGNYERADAITGLDPQLAKVATQSTGETRARDAVSIEDAKERKDVLAGQQQQTDLDTRREVDNLFQAAKDNKPPPGYEAVKTNDPNRVEFVHKDKQGEVTERLTATRGPDNQVTLDTSTLGRDGRASRDVVSTNGPEGTTTSQHAEWTPGPGQGLSTPPSIDDLKNSRDPAVTVEEDSVRREGADLITSNYRQAEGGVTGAETRYSQQTDEDGLDDKFKGKFDGDKPIDRVETRTYSIPPPGTEGDAGKPTYTRTQTFSQGEGSTGVQATSTASKQLEGDDFQVDGGPRNASDLEHLRDNLRSEDGEDGESFDGNEDSPKQWTLETTNGNQYASQTFVEGHEDASIITRRSATGSTVKEEVEGKTFSTQKGKEGELVDIRSTSSRTYNEQGQVTRAHAESKGPDGVSTVQDYQRTERRGAEGRLEVDERTTSSQTQPDGGPTSTSTVEQRSRQGDDGQMQLTSASQTVTGPGGTASATHDAKDGPRLTVNGQRIQSQQQLEALPKEQGDLGAIAHDGLLQQKQGFAATAPKLPPLEGGKAEKKDNPVPASSGDWKAGATASKDALGLLQHKALASNNGNLFGPSTNSNSKLLSTEGRFSIAGLGVASGVLGAVSGAAGFATSIQQGNYIEATKNAAEAGGSVTSGIQAYQGYRATPNDIRSGASGIVGKGGAIGGSAGFKAAFTTSRGFRDALSAGGKLGVAGTALGVVSGGMDVVGGIKSGDGWQIAKGGVSIAGAIGAGVAIGAIGGPAGAAVGLAIGVGVFAAGKVFDAFSDKEHQIADVKI